VAAPPGPMSAALSAAVRGISKRQKRRRFAIGHQPEVPAPPTVAPVRAAPRNMGLPPERHRTSAAVAPDHTEVGLVYEGAGPAPAGLFGQAGLIDQSGITEQGREFFSG